MLRCVQWGFSTWTKAIMASSHSFTQKLNVITGKIEWELQREDYDYHQEIARSAYGDMLHDSERNRKYNMALQRAIDKQHRQGLRANVLDIGTGTGLLSMMAVRCGADHVVACEAFLPMADCAEKIISDNGMADHIKLVRKRSTEITVGIDGDMPFLANILVTEVFDTELIGEHALQTFNHACENLLEKDCIVIPSRATVYGQVVQSDLITKWNRLFPIAISEKKRIEVPEDVHSSCPGSELVHDIQLSQLPEEKFQILSDILPVFRFEWNKPTPVCDVSVRPFVPLRSGIAQAVFMWWDLSMDEEGDIILSCAPHWAHPDTKYDGAKPADSIPWRDHWMQAIYYLEQGQAVSKDTQTNLVTFHDEFTFRFRLEDIPRMYDTLPNPAFCSCNAHNCLSRTRFGMLNDHARNQKYVSALRKVIDENSVCLCLGDGSILPIIAASLNAKAVHIVESDPWSGRLVQKLIDYNRYGNTVKIFSENMLCTADGQKRLLEYDGEVTVVLAEPFYSGAILPWHYISFWYRKDHLKSLLSNDVKTVPQKAKMWMVGVESKDLWKIRAPVENIEGFTLATFDQLIQESIDVSDPPVEPQPLWEYPCRALTDACMLMEFDFCSPLPEKTLEQHVSVHFGESGVCNAVAVWIDWNLDGENIVSTGPVSPVILGEEIQWDMYSKQGIALLREGIKVNSDCTLHCDVEFNPLIGDVGFRFSTVTQ